MPALGRPSADKGIPKCITRPSASDGGDDMDEFGRGQSATPRALARSMRACIAANTALNWTSRLGLNPTLGKLTLLRFPSVPSKRLARALHLPPRRLPRRRSVSYNPPPGVEDERDRT